jgi:hypothetical protein
MKEEKSKYNPDQSKVAHDDIKIGGKKDMDIDENIK